MQLPRHTLPLPLLRLHHPLGHLQAFFLQPIQHGVEQAGQPADVGIGEVGTRPGFVHPGLHGGHRRLQLAQRTEGDPQDEEVDDQDGDQSPQQEDQQHRQQRPGDLEGDQRAADGAHDDDGAVGDHELLESGQIPVPEARIHVAGHISF